jgi:hypothetical protein
MNEIAVRRQAVFRAAQAEPRRKSDKRNSSFYGYWSLVLAVSLGWLLRDLNLIDPGQGLGYWLGIIGAAAMAILLLYPLRKKIPILRCAGAVRHWFRLHMIMGLIGPLLILYHCNFKLGSFNSQVALYTMLIVTLSGIFGRHFYARIHHGLYGRKATLAELQDELAASLEKSHGLAAIVPNLATALEMMSLDLQGDRITRTLGIRRSLRWSVKQYYVRYSLNRIARRELALKANESPTVSRDLVKLRAMSKRYVEDYVRLMVKVAQFSFYERIFSIWHIFHFPLFLMLILTALVHVLAVHMY